MECMNVGMKYIEAVRARNLRAVERRRAGRGLGRDGGSDIVVGAE